MRRHGAVKPPTPKDIEGRKRYPVGARLAAAPITVNRQFPLTSDQRRYYDQLQTYECVAFSISQLMTLLNGHIYHPGWLYWRAQEIDGIPGHDGTTSDAALLILRDRGHVRHQMMPVAPTDDPPGVTPIREDGIVEFRWFSTNPDAALEEARACINQGMAFVVASPWYQTFGHHQRNGGTWMDSAGDWGTPDGMWHQYLIDGAFDDGGYLTTPNSWGWPQSQRLSYGAFKRLIGEGAVCAAVTDRVGDVPVPPEPPLPVPSLTCPYCGKVKKTEQRLKRHIRRQHRGQA